MILSVCGKIKDIDERDKNLNGSSQMIVQSAVHMGMMIVIDEEQWLVFRNATPSRLAQLLRILAKVDPRWHTAARLPRQGQLYLHWFR
jgi:hypothetical protein